MELWCAGVECKSAGDLRSGHGEGVCWYTAKDLDTSQQTQFGLKLLR